jgi:hypothetical protein
MPIPACFRAAIAYILLIERSFHAVQSFIRHGNTTISRYPGIVEENYPTHTPTVKFQLSRFAQQLPASFRCSAQIEEGTAD